MRRPYGGVSAGGLPAGSGCARPTQDRSETVLVAAHRARGGESARTWAANPRQVLVLFGPRASARAVQRPGSIVSDYLS